MSDEGKQSLRKSMRDARDSLTTKEREQADVRIVEAVFALPELAHADCLLAYRSVGSEVDTVRLMELAWRQGLTVALPRCVPGRRQLTWHVVDGLGGLVRGPWGVEEPDPVRHVELAPDGLANPIALVPGLAFDRCGYRLGYGGGFYDLFLRDFAGVSVGVCRGGQLIESLAALHALECHDVAVDVVVSDVQVLRP